MGRGDFGGSVGKGKRTKFHFRPQDERNKTVWMTQADMRQNKVANHFGVSRMTITRFMSRLGQAVLMTDQGAGDHGKLRNFKTTKFDLRKCVISLSP
jgi:DNA-binding transcriptional regulator LsrR (DeoR family)